MKIQIHISNRNSLLMSLAVLGSCLCVLIQLYAIPHRIPSLVSLSARMLQLIWLAMGAWTFLTKIGRHFPRKMVSFLLLVLFAAASLLMATLENIGGLVFNGVRWMGFLTLPIMLLCAAMEPTEDARRITMFYHVMSSLIYINLYHSGLRHYYVGDYGGTYLDAVTLGYSNPNQAAMMLLVCAIGLVCGVLYFKSAIVKLLLIADAGYISWIMMKTESRTTAMLLLVFLALVWWSSKRSVTKKGINATFIIPLVILMLPIVIPAIDRITFLGDSLFTGREEIYSRYFDILSPKLIALGAMDLFRFDNLHNGYVAIAASLGVPVCVFYTLFLRNNLLCNIPDCYRPMFERAAFVGFLCLILQTSAEAAFLVGGTFYSFLLYSIFVLFARPYAHEC